MRESEAAPPWVKGVPTLGRKLCRGVQVESSECRSPTSREWFTRVSEFAAFLCDNVTTCNVACTML